MRAKGGARSGGDRLARSEPFEMFRRPQRSLPARILGLVIRLRAELLVLLVAVWVWVWLVHRMPTWTAGVVVGVPAVGVALWAPGRRFVTRRGLAVVTRHRLRAVFVECRVMNFSGNSPLLFWSRPTAVGERVWVWLRAGIDLRDVELRLSHIAVGCVGVDARVAPHRLTAALVVVEVIRRDPLSGPAVVSPITAARSARFRPIPAIGGDRHA